MSLYSSLLLSSINSSRLYRPHELCFVSVVSAICVSLGQFYRYLVCIHHGTRPRTTFKFHNEEEVKETRRAKSASSLNALKESKKEHINVPSVSAARTNASSLVFEGEKGVFMVCKWFKMLSRSWILWGLKNVFFSSQTLVWKATLYMHALNATVWALLESLSTYTRAGKLYSLVKRCHESAQTRAWLFVVTSNTLNTFELH